MSGSGTHKDLRNSKNRKWNACIQDSVIDHRAAVCESRWGCAGGGDKNDCQISGLNGWIKGCQVPSLDQGILVKGTGFYRRCHQKVLCNINNTHLRKPKRPKFFTFNSGEREAGIICLVHTFVATL